LKADIENERALVEWMHPTVAMLKKSAGQTKSTKKTPRLSTIEKAFSNAGLSPFVKHLSQNENKEIVVHMQDVPFASFAQCLEDLDTKNGIEPLSLSATKKSAGIVDADIVF
jgi:type II secretory pathway component PulM